ncbi:MAG TPA: hypothetical protein VN654_09180 [Vicinamibacterales bacterium]|jgi:hypothetical protein|nr:hypothetical protein [Vicinamibacterales bacterium]
MARPRKTAREDPFSDLSKKAEILEREMSAQRAAIERLKQIGKERAQPLSAGAVHDAFSRRRASR